MAAVKGVYLSIYLSYKTGYRSIGVEIMSEFYNFSARKPLPTQSVVE